MSRVLVIGGGAAGLLAAGAAAEYGAEVTLLEKNPRMARKVMITGKGRCNVTNAADLQQLIANVPTNGRFLYSAFSNFTPEDVRDLLNDFGVETKVERGNRVFPVSDKAVDVVDALVAYARSNGVFFEQAQASSLLLEDGCCVGVVDSNGKEWRADAVAICTGGASYPQTGSTGDGYALAQQAGHTIVPIVPSLVPLCVKEYDCSQMQGLSLRNCALRVVDTVGGKTVFEDMGEMMFTHFGVTGPLVLSASAHLRPMESERYAASVDLKPALSEKQLDERLLREIGAHQNSAFSTMLATLVPRSMIAVVASRCGMPLSLVCNSITKEQRVRLNQVLKNFSFTIEAFRPISEAIVTSGGIDVREVDAKTMRSKLCEGLYFAGEVLDVDAYTGGFNLQIAFSTGVAAGRAMAMI